MRGWFAGFVACGLLAGCSAGAAHDAGGQDTPVVTMGLSSFDACGDVLDHLRTEALERVGPWGLQTRHGGAVAEPLAVDDSAESAAPSQPTAPHSTTNVQEAGVDEPDVVKTDGQLIVTVAHGDLRVVDVTGDSPRAIGRLPLGGSVTETRLLLSGDHAVVFSQNYPVVAFDSRSSAPVDQRPARPESTVRLVDLSDPADPTVEATLHVDGTYLDARMTDGTVRLVVSTAPSLVFSLSQHDGRAGHDELTARNEALIKASTIDDWLPSYRLFTDGEETSGRLVECEQLDRPEEFAGFSTMSVLTLDIDDDQLSSGAGVGVLTDGDTVYASDDRLYVATTGWGDVMPMEAVDSPMIAPPTTVTTGIHAFDTSGDASARYVASGEVDGRIIGRYALSEHDGVLRVATTEQARSGAAQSQLVTLEERGDDLVQLGHVGGLGKGEDIYAVRYAGETGYVVTFRQVDPLYVLDLSDPTAPTVTGELKITGYSAYLHDAGDGRLLGIGQEATADGRAVGAQVSLFDVSDPAAPTKLDGHVVPNAWTHAEWDPHAFLYWEPTGQLVVPMDRGGSSDILVLRVGDARVTEHGTISRSEQAPVADYATASRSLVVGDTLYVLWSAGLQANDLDDLQEQAWVDLR